MEGPLMEKDTEPNQQLGDVLLIHNEPNDFGKGSVMKHSCEGTSKLVVIANAFRTSSGQQRYTIRPLNGTTTSVSSPSKLKEIPPNPVDIPTGPADVDTEVMTQTLSKEDLDRLWSGDSDSTITDDQRITLYWHHRLRCCPLVTLHRLAKRGVLPKRILKVLKMPLCASCAFATAHRRAWRTKAKKTRGIRRDTDILPGDGISCDHILSNYPGLVQQHCGK